MMKLEQMKTVNRIVLGLVMLVPGLMKLFVMKPAAVTGMLAGIGFPAPAFFAWVLILAEIVAGLAILAEWKVKEASTVAAVILLVAAFTVHLQNIPSFLVHLAAVTNFLVLGMTYCPTCNPKEKK